MQSEQTHDVQGSPPQLAQVHTAWLQLGQVQSVHTQVAQESWQSSHWQRVHSS